MKPTFLSILLVAALAGYGHAMAAETFVVVEISTNLDARVPACCKIVSASEAQEIQKGISAETQVYSKALELTRKAWDEANAIPKSTELTTKPIPPRFPIEMLAPRKCVLHGAFSEKEKAQKHLAKVQKDADAAIQIKIAAKNKSAGSQKNAVAAMQANVAHAATELQGKIAELVKTLNTSGGDTTNNVKLVASFLPAKGDALPKYN